MTRKRSSVAVESNVDKEEASILVEETKMKRVMTSALAETVRTFRPNRLASSVPSDFPSRLGYACINSILRQSKPEEIFCGRTTRIATIESKGLEYAKELGRRNVLDMLPILKWNEAHDIRFMRLSSDMFPFASHLKYGYSLSYCEAELRQVGELAKSLGHRLTCHPGQTNNLGSTNPVVIDQTVRDLEYHSEMLDKMGLDQDSVMIIHMGGTYGDKPATLSRFRENFLTRLPKHIQARLVLENDEICYNAEELLPLCEELSIPLVFDWHHHLLNPGTVPLAELLARIKLIWQYRGIKQKMHHSESRPGATTLMERRAHSDFVSDIPMCGNDVDLMIEAKMKEQAVLFIKSKYKLLTPSQELSMLNSRQSEPADERITTTKAPRIRRRKVEVVSSIRTGNKE